MSRIAWKQTLTAPYGDISQSQVWEAHGFQVPRAFRLNEEDEKLAELPEPRAYQVLNRKAMLLAAVGLQSRPLLASLIEEDPFSVGLYCAAEKGPGDFNVTYRMIGEDLEQFATIYKGNRSPKRFFKEIANIPVSHLGMFLGITGPHLAFTNSNWACLHALEQAELDLEMGVVKAALVCAAFAIEDPIAVLRLQRQLSPTSVMVEAAAALILLPDQTKTDWRARCQPANGHSFGTAHDLLHIAMEAQI